MKATTVKSKLPKGVKGITILRAESTKGLSTTAERVEVRPKNKRKRKKSKGIARVWERLIRHNAKANKRISETYLDRHQRSRKRRDGWLRDINVNMARAHSKGMKELKLSKLLG